MAVFIEWDVEMEVFDGWLYTRNGEYQPLFHKKKAVRSALYSKEVNPAIIANAEAYVKSDRPEARVIVR